MITISDQSRIEPGRWLKPRAADSEIIERISTSDVQRDAKISWCGSASMTNGRPDHRRSVGAPGPLNAVESALDTIEAL